MKKLAVLFLVVSFVLAVGGLTGCGNSETSAPAPAKEESVSDLLAKGKNNPGMSFDYVMTSKDAKMDGKMWIEGKKMRTELTMENQKMISIVDGVANVAYMYNPDEKTALKLPLDKVKPNKVDAPDKRIQDMDPAKVKVVETTTYDGVRCRVLLVQEPSDKSEVKLWVREDYGIPIRTEITDPNGEKMVVEYKNLKIGPVPVETFTVPADTQITDMSEMMKQMQP